MGGVFWGREGGWEAGWGAAEGVWVTGRWPAFIGSIGNSATELFLESCAAAGLAGDVIKRVLDPFWDVKDWANFGA